MPADALPPLPRRPADSHKGTFGTVCVVGGCCRGDTVMIGAPALAAAAALRVGAGLARLFCPRPILAHAIALCPSATGRAVEVDGDGEMLPHEAAAAIDDAARSAACIAIGPGLGTGAGAQAAALRAIQQEEAPVVVDADAINSLAALPDLGPEVRAAAVFTPHPGEFKTLAESLGQRDHCGLAASREQAAERMAQRLGCIIVLKGRRTVVSDGARTWTNDTDHPCLATGGAGDVLTGVIAGLISQFVASPPPVALPGGRSWPKPPGRPLDLFDAARVAVFIHGRAGEEWAASRGSSAGLLASDLLDLLPPLVESQRGRG